MARRWITLQIILLVSVLCTIRYITGIFHRNEEPLDKPLAELSTAEKKLLAATCAAKTAHDPLFVPPLRTQGRYIVDARGERFKLASVNWYGASDELHTPGGLNVQHRSEIARTIRQLGFNSVRLPYADQMVRDNREVPAHLVAANADLAGLRALEVYAAVVESLTDAGLAVIINNHITQSRWCCDANICDIMWTNSFFGFFCPVRQTEEDWIKHWEIIMKPHVDDPLVVGADLRNEPRGLIGARGWKAWAAAAERVGERLLSMQPDWLIIVEGTYSANSVAREHSRPVKLSLQNRLVYSVHVYGWSGWGEASPYWGRSYASFAKDMHNNWGYLLEEDIAPVWLGEFGAPEKPNKGDMHYWKNLMKYLHKSDVDFGFWAINPRKPRGNMVETYSLVEDDWKTPKLDYRLYDLVQIMKSAAKLRKSG